LPALSARADLLAARGEWAGALADLETALVSQPDDPRLRLRRGELMLRQGDWWRGLGDYEARLEIPGERYAPDLPRWQGEPLDGPAAALSRTGRHRERRGPCAIP
jgi:tetratricopeptide (TPR) repeat protein